MNNNKNDAIVDVEKNQLENIATFYKYLSKISIITALLFVISSLVLIIEYFDAIIAFFEYFEGAKSIKRFIIAEFTNKFELTQTATVVIILYGYFSLFGYIKKRRMATFEDKIREGKYFHFIQDFFANFNFVILFPLLFYLFVIKLAIFEPLTIIVSYIIGTILFIRIIKFHNKIILDYNLLSSLDISSVVDNISNMVKNAKCDLKNGDFHIDKEEYQQHFKSLQKGTIWYILNQIPTILKSIFGLTFITAFFGLIFEFNVLSIIYLELNLVMWYSIVSAVSYLPKKTVSITLNTGEIIEDVYILEDSPKEYIRALTPENKMIKIMTGSVMMLK